MTKLLKDTKEFSDKSKHAIATEELGELPVKFPGASRFDYLVVDTADYFTICENLLQKNQQGWRAIIPIVPGDQTGLTNIPLLTARLMLRGFMLDQPPKLYVVMNRCSQADVEQGLNEVSKAMDRHGAKALLCKVWIPLAEAKYHPLFVDQREFSEAVDRLLVSIGVQKCN